MIIKLTECRNNNGVEKENFDIWVNMDHFVTMNRSIKGRDTHMKLTGAYLFVKETPEEIMRMVEFPLKQYAAPLKHERFNIPGAM